MQNADRTIAQSTYSNLASLLATLNPQDLSRGPLAISEWFQGRYQVTDLLGYGHSSIVLKALDTRLDRTVALKVWYDFGFGVSSEILLKEGKLLSGLNHPHVVQVFDHGYDEELKRPWMALEYLGSETLLDFIESRKDQAVNWGLVMDLATQLASLLDYLHNSAFLFQLDVKPGNLSFDRKRSVVKMMDFGSAYTSKNTYVEKLGTPGYMAPELFTAGTVTKAADLFSFGMLLCKLITGINPIEAFQRKAPEVTLHVQSLFTGGTMAIPMDLTVDLTNGNDGTPREVILQQLGNIAAGMKDASVTSPLVAAGTPPGLQYLIEELTNTDASKRPSANEVRLRLTGIQHRKGAAVPSLFISHASQDKQRFVLTFAECLKGKGFTVWLDEWDLHVGEPFWDRIAEAIDSSDFVLVVLSRFAASSPGVAEELRTAQLSNLDKVKILPIRIDPVDYNAIPRYLRSRHILDFVGWEGNEAIFYKKVDKLAADIWALYESR